MQRHIQNHNYEGLLQQPRISFSGNPLYLHVFGNIRGDQITNL